MKPRKMPYIIRNDQLYITYQPDAVQNVKTLQTLNIRSNGDYVNIRHTMLKI